MEERLGYSVVQKMNRKGDFDIARKSIYWTIASFIITIVVLAFAFGLSAYKKNVTMTPPQLRAEIIVLRFTTLPECFASVDVVSGVAIAGVIDSTKFTPDVVNQCYPLDTEKGFKEFNFRFVLEQGGETIATNNYFNHDDFTLYKEVLVKRQGNIFKDRLIIYVQEKI